MVVLEGGGEVNDSTTVRIPIDFNQMDLYSLDRLVLELICILQQEVTEFIVKFKRNLIVSDH